MNKCPATIRRGNRRGIVEATTCGGWLAFVGISVHRTFGWRRWTRCTSPYCGLFTAFDADGFGAITQRTEPPKGMFRSSPD